VSRAPVAPERRCLKFIEWPSDHKKAWLAGIEPGDGLDDFRYGAGLKPRTLSKIEKGYGRWLGFLAHRGLLEVASVPGSPVTAQNIRAYIRLMQALGNRDYTVVGRVVELQLALRILEPSQDFRWLTSPGGTALRSILTMAARRLERYDTRHLYLWGLHLMDTSLVRSPVRRRVQFRDGLLIAVLASRAPRLRSVTAICFGQHVIRADKGFRLIFGSEDIKTNRPIEYRLPASLTPYIERYLEVERRELLKGQSHDAFWVNWNGDPLGEVGVEKRIRWHSEKKFGKAFGPHRFRHALGTSQAIEDPANPAAGAVILGISPAMVEKHYNVGGQVEAAQAFIASVDDARSESADIARRVFERT
jgi:hypothetical protein